MPTDVYTNGAVEGTNSALDATTGLRNNMTGCQRFMALESTGNGFLYTHKMGYITLISRIRQVPQSALG